METDLFASKKSFETFQVFDNPFNNKGSWQNCEMVSEACSESCERSKMEQFAKILISESGYLFSLNASS